MYKVKVGGLKLETEDLKQEKKENRIAFIRRLLVSFMSGLVIFSTVFFFSWNNGVKEWLHYFSNACFASGVLLAATGSFSIINKQGFFDVAQFGLKQFGQTIKYSMAMKKDLRVDTDIISFKEEKRKVRVANWPALIVGLVFIVAAFISAAFV